MTTCNDYKPYKHNVGFVYRPYYNYYENDPYFESTYISQHNEIYDPTCSMKIKLKDGTIIEGFGLNTNLFYLLLIFVVLFYLIIKSQQ